MNNHAMLTSPDSFNALLVSVSVVIAVAGAYAALDLAARAHREPQDRLLWISAAALAFGAGVWSMHFVGMLAYRAPVPVSYDVALTGTSLVAVLVASWCGFNLAARRSTRWWTIPAAGVVTGTGVCAMHYIGMAGMQMPAEMSYDPGLFAISILCALASSTLALWLAFRQLSMVQGVIGAIILGTGVSGLHYIGMAAVHIGTMHEVPIASASGAARPGIAVSATLGAIGIFLWIIVGSLLERWRALQAIAREQARYQSIVDTAVDPIIVSDQDGSIISFNAAAERAFGYKASEAVGTNIRLVIPDVHGDASDSDLKRDHRTGERRVMEGGREVKGRRKNGTTFPIDLAVTEWWSGNQRYYTGILRDRTEQQQAEQALFQSEQRLSMAIEATGGGVFEYHLPLTEDVYVSPRACEILGYAELPFEPRHFELWFSEQLHPEDLADWQQSYEAFLSGRQTRHELDMRLKHRDGHWVWVRVMAQAVGRDGSGAICQVSGMIFDITSRKEAQQAVEHLAFHDPLTELPNRTLFNTRLSEALEHAERIGARVAVVMIDLDNFKYVNDTLGHRGGDDLLKIVSRRIVGAIREYDTVARLGGDEFAVILSDIRLREGIDACVRRLRTALAHPTRIEDHPISITASFGIACFPDDADDTDDLLRHADLALYKAKEQPADSNVCFFEEKLALTAARRARVERDLRRAVEQQEFRLYYQPQVELGTGRIRTVEALVRWEHPTRGLMLPGEFISVAESSGIIRSVGAWVLQEACRQQAQWRAQGYLTKIAVNVSPAEINVGDFTGVLDAALQYHSGIESSIELEITEGLLMDIDAPSVRRFLKALASRNMDLALDDFGKGFSSLSYLGRLPFSKVKIDRSFVARIGQSNDNALIETIINLGHRLGKRVVAEGVETEVQHRYLEQVGCDDVQGYLYCHPLDETTMTSLLAQGTLLIPGQSASLSAI
ncbi:EAL domain-containing protein [Paracoccus sp. WLY502]|uniref:bifunctional diguanylate cyclase/phosphodiesterase n=1 Tax=Paracoccus yibinensis TaxID=3068891 RepID=UPI0027967BE6|nr:EAL domain-containing protein [Paracoccus sp. WLY502]MDQ1902930.1 EAL domain-containing protein [Paracoccus sp. WLY502]